MSARDIGNAELLGPVSVLGDGGLITGAPVEAHSKLVVHRGTQNKHVGEDAVDVIHGRRLGVRVDLAPVELRLVIAFPRPMPGLGIAAEDFVIGGELVIDFAVPAGAPHVLDGVQQ